MGTRINHINMKEDGTLKNSMRGLHSLLFSHTYIVLDLVTESI